MMSTPGSRLKIKQFFLYCVTGSILNSLGFSLYVLITYFGVEPKSAMTVLYFIGVIVSFFVNKKIVFSHGGFCCFVFAKFCLVHFSGYVINLFLLS